MSLRFFAIPACDPLAAEAELNHLLATSRVLSVERHFVANGEASFWAVCVRIAGGPGPLPEALKADQRTSMDQTRRPAGTVCRAGEPQGARGAGRRPRRMPAPTAPRVADSAYRPAAR